MCLKIKENFMRFTNRRGIPENREVSGKIIGCQSIGVGCNVLNEQKKSQNYIAGTDFGRVKESEVAPLIRNCNGAIHEPPGRMPIRKQKMMILCYFSDFQVKASEFNMKLFEFLN
jgi:hypothetical protein